MSAAGAAGRGRLAWLQDLALGARLSVAGGRSGWARLAMIAAGVGFGVAMLLMATALPSVGAARAARTDARAPGAEVAAPGADTLLTASVRSRFGDTAIEGRLLQPEGDRAPLPPGVGRRLAPGEMVVSPALADLMAAPGGELLRQRWDARVVGTIAPSGLAGPSEVTFYLGTDRLATGAGAGGVAGADGRRIRSFGNHPGDPGALPPPLVVLAVVGLVALLLPVMIFVTTAVRFGSEARDRQLAAIRLVGAEAATTRRVAAGETLTGTLLGLAAGGLLFLGAGRVAGAALPAGLGYFPADLRPVPALLALVVLLVPAAAVLVTLSALRRVVIEPLGVVRPAGERHRRLWWRLALPAAGLALLYPLFGGVTDTGSWTEIQLAAGVAFLLVGVSLLLPWLVQALVHRLGGGGVAWQLAVRRLQLDSGTAVRAVSGVAVSVAGVIAVQGVLAAFQAGLSADQPPADRFQATVYLSPYPLQRADDPGRRLAAALDGAPGIRAVSGASALQTAGDRSAGGAEPPVVRVGDCAALRQYAKVTGCVDGDSFVVDDEPPGSAPPGTVLTLEGRDGSLRWTVPAGLRPVASYATPQGGGTTFLVTPAALGAAAPDPMDLLVALDPGDPGAIERLRNATARVDPFAAVQLFQDGRNGDTLAGVRRALVVGESALLLIIGASLLVNVLEQLRERRRLLAVLMAFGTRRTVLSGSVLYQVAIPMVLGVSLAVAVGTGLATSLQSVAGVPVWIDWSGIAGVSGAAVATVLAVTAASLPLLWRLTRPEGLRSE